MGTGNPKYSNFQERDSVSGLMNTFHSIGAMPAYSKKTNEELRWEDYQQNRKGAVGFGLSTPGVFGGGGSLSTSSVPTSMFSQPALSSVGFGSSPFGGSQPAVSSSFGGFGSASTITPSSVVTTAPLFGTTPGTSGAASSFGAGSTGLFGAPSTGSLFGSAPGATPQTTSFGLTGPSSAASAATPAFAQTGSPFGQKPASIPSFFGRML